MRKKMLSWVLTVVMLLTMASALPMNATSMVQPTAVFMDDDLDNVYFIGDTLSFNLSGLPVGDPPTGIPADTPLRVSLGIVDSANSFSDFTLFNTLSNGMGDGTGWYAERTLLADGTLSSEISGQVVETPAPPMGAVAVKLYVFNGASWQNVLQGQPVDFIVLSTGSQLATVGLDGVMEMPDGVTSDPVIGSSAQDAEDLRSLDISFTKTIALDTTGTISFTDLDLLDNSSDLTSLDDGLIMDQVADPASGTLAQFTLGVDTDSLAFLTGIGATVSATSASFDGYQTSDFEAAAADVTGGLVSGLAFDDSTDTVSFTVNHFSSYTLSVLLADVPEGNWLSNASEGFARGDGSSESPFEIETPEQLAYLAVLAAIDNGATSPFAYALAADIDLSADYWVPIAFFNGQFDGRGHTISGLKIDSSADYQGLFGTCNGARLSHIRIEDCEITSTGYYCGALSGQAISLSATDCLSSGEVTANGDVGGLIGRITTGANDLTECGSSCTVTSTAGTNASHAGGLIGTVSAATTNIDQCYATGNVTGGENSGGFVGIAYNSGGVLDITDSYQRGSVYSSYPDGWHNTGGMVGLCHMRIDLTNCYAAGQVTASSGTYKLGGLVGGNDGYPINTINSFYNSANRPGQGGGTPLSVTSVDDELDMLDTLAGTDGYDFVAALNDSGSAWAADPGSLNSGFPMLAWQKITEPSAPALQGAEVNTAGDKLILTFDKAMADPAGKHGQFSITADGDASAVTAVALDTGNSAKIELALAAKILQGQTVSVSYTAGDVQASDGGVLTTFTDQPAVNNSTAEAGTILLEEDFETAAGNTPPAGWVNQNNTWFFGMPPYTIPAHSGSNAAKFNSYYLVSDVTSRLYTAGLDFTAASEYHLSFWMLHTNSWFNSPDRVEVQVSTNGGADWTTLTTFDRYSEDPGWQEHALDLSAYAGSPSVQIGFNAISGYGDDMYIDLVRVSRLGPAEPEYACRIGGENYLTLAEALEATESGDTITLLQDISYDERIWAGSSFNPSLTLDLNGYKLDISDVEVPLAALDGRYVTVTDSSVSGGGVLELNTTSSDSAPTGLTAVGTGSSVTVDSKVTVNITSTADNGKGVFAYYGGTVLLGNASVTVPISESSTAVYADGAASSISITGNINGGWAGVATNGGSISITGDVSTGYSGSGSGVRAIGGTISINGNVSATGSGDYGVYADSMATVTVTGDVTSGSVGAAAYNGSQITIDGTITYNVAFIEIGSYANYLDETDYTEATTKAGYRTYTDDSSTVWVKSGAPFATNVGINGSPVIGTTLTGTYDFNGGTESGTTYRWLRNIGSPLPITAITSIAGVSNNPYNPSIVTVAEDSLITFIYTYHYFNGGKLPGTIALKEVGGDETVYGPWIALGAPGQGGVDNAYWNVYPNLLLPAGSYQVIDSDPATWSWADDTNGRGIVALFGEPTYAEDEYTPIDGATGQQYTLTTADGGCMLKFEVTVQDSDEISGSAVTSDPIGPVVSEAETQLSSDATLSALTASGITLTPAFDSATTSYSASVKNSISSTTVSAVPADDSATVTINGTAGSSQAVALKTGGNTITITVTAENGTTTKTYTIDIDRASSGGGGGGDGGGGATPAGTGTKITVTTTDGSASVPGTLTQTNGRTQVVIKNADFQTVNAANQPASVNAQLASVTFDQKAIDTIGAAAGTGDVTLTVRQVPASELSAGDQAKVGDRPIYELTVTSGGQTISDFKGGHAIVTIPYALKPGENPNAVVIYYLTNDGKLIAVRGHYDADLQAVVFKTTHFSKFVIGYHPVSFNDVAAGAWYKNAVDCIAAQGITSGTGNNAFSPDAKLTRGQFVVLLMNAYQISTQSRAEVNFADAGNTYYTDYLAAAKGLGIINGIGGNQFAPDKEITRQEMFVMLYNALKAIDEVPTAVNSKKLTDFNDAANAADWANEALTSLVQAGVVGGYNNRLDPAATTTRAEIAQVLYNLLTK